MRKRRDRSECAGSTISVAMATYNGEQFLREQLDSILAQSRLPDELVVCDDRSSDGTLELLREYASRSPFQMTVVSNDERLGSTRNFEKAISLCSGNLIALSDQDDVWRPEKLDVLERAFAANPELGVVLTNADLIDENGTPLRGDLWSRVRFGTGRQQALNGPRRYDLLLGLPVSTGATMAFRSRFKPLLLPFPTEAPTFIHDRWITVVIAAVAEVAAIPDRLIAYRLHGQQQLGVGKVPLARRLFMAHPCRSDAVGLAALEERLKGDPRYLTQPDFWRALHARQRHVGERAAFSRNPLRRFAQVAVEFRSGGYNPYPYGAIISVQDLLAGTR
jgi:hypothetical protein